MMLGRVDWFLCLAEQLQLPNSAFFQFHHVLMHQTFQTPWFWKAIGVTDRKRKKSKKDGRKRGKSEGDKGKDHQAEILRTRHHQSASFSRSCSVIFVGIFHTELN